MSQHTPGPWHIAGGVQIRSERDQVAKVWMMRHGEGQANARLIAKAPELLEVLEYFMPLIESEQDDEQQAPWVEKARALIAEVKGEQEKN